MRLLVVEDDRTIREFLTRALAESGFGVDASGLGREAEKLALEGVHDALIVDLTLPDMDGLELIQRLRAGDLEIDLIRREARRGGTEIQLTQQEFALLEYLCRNAGRVVTRAMVLDHVWKMRIDTSTNIVDVHIHRLRNKVDRDSQQPLIRTIRGVGYVLKD